MVMLTIGGSLPRSHQLRQQAGEIVTLDQDQVDEAQIGADGQAQQEVEDRGLDSVRGDGGAVRVVKGELRVPLVPLHVVPGQIIRSSRSINHFAPNLLTLSSPE